MNQCHRRESAVADIRYCDEFFYISRMSWSDRFWRWAANELHDPLFYRRADMHTHAILTGREHGVDKVHRFQFVVTSTQIRYPLLMVERPAHARTQDELITYILGGEGVTIGSDFLLQDHMQMVRDALLHPMVRRHEFVGATKITQLIKAGSTAQWVANKMQGKYDGANQAST